MTSPERPPVVLVVDDAAVVRRIIAMTVHEIPELSTAIIEEAENGTIALDKLCAKSYDLIISEIQVHGIDGLALVRHVRQDLADATTPILLISRLEQADGSDAGEAVGASAYVPKPLSPYRIKRAIRRILSAAAGAGPSEPNRILIVDDDDVFRNFTAHVLASSGYATDQAENGAVAVERLKKSKSDVVLLDLCMPVMDGWGVLNFVRTMEARPRVVVVTGVLEVVPPGHLSHCISGYVFKPFRAGQLVQTCEDVLARPPVIARSGDRKQPRRTFIADASVLSADGQPIAHGMLVEVSAGGLRLELGATVDPGRDVRVAFHVPGHPHAIEVPGVVRWSDATTMGTEVATFSGSDDAVLRALVDLD